MSKIFKMLKKNKEILTQLSVILGILTVILTGIVFLYQFLNYTYEIQWFNYWNIDTIFYSNDNNEIINGLLYGMLMICFLLIFSIAIHRASHNKLSKLKKICNWFKVTAVYIFFYFLFGLQNLYRYNFEIGTIISEISSAIFTFIILKKASQKIVQIFNIVVEKKTLKNELIDIVLFILISMVSLFITFIIMGNLTCLIKRDYKIITSENNTYSVILYSAKDYYIIADCQIYDDEIIVNKSKQSKIDNDNIKYENKKFSKIKKI